MNIRLGEMSAAEAIGLANQSYRNAAATSSQAFVSQDSGESLWETLFASVFKVVTPQAPVVVAAPQPKPSVAPYVVAGGAALAAVLLLK